MCLWGDLDQDQSSKITVDHGASKKTIESMIRLDSSIPLMHDDPDRSWVTDPDPDHPKGMHPKCCRNTQIYNITVCINIY